ncbi:hypothetical protein [Pseudomonas sp. GL-B-16]|uniref:hypothetical protein n=1 Tax=Pseudomonas sp. GL-B-16 TaxID=2832373 RepID=UPI001CBD9486|nr:hypothetical protein [Pseudomonas sp. GL-B-16]
MIITTDYEKLFKSLRDHLISNSPRLTKDITECIKVFFRHYFSTDHTVLCSHAEGSEYLTDILVTSFDPKKIVQPRTLSMVSPALSVHLAAESELGGVGASSAYGVMKNVVEDYIKLLLIRCSYRVMIFTSLPYADEIDHVQNRIETLRNLYASTPKLDSGMLLVHLTGTQPKSSQVQAIITEDSVRGFIISECGNLTQEVAVQAV